jgi:hypothetical protein
MRYYSISIPGAPDVFKPVPGASIPGAQWDTWVKDGNDPSAQQIEFSIDMQTDGTPSDNSTIIIKGVSWDQIKVTNLLINLPIVFYGGMQPGLPLATAQSQHEKLIIRAIIKRAWGNWEGTEMSIGLNIFAGLPKKTAGNGGNGGGQQLAGLAEQAIGAFTGGGGGGSAPTSLKYMKNIRKLKFKRTGFRSIDTMPFARGPMVVPTTVGADASGGSGFDMSGFGVDTPGVGGDLFGGGVPGLSAPLNLIHNLMPNMSLSSGIQETLGKAFPGANVVTNIHPGLKLPYQDAGMYQNMKQYAGYLKSLSQSVLGTKNYNGIQTSSHDNTIHVWDGTQPPINMGTIRVIDLIGQPGWIDQQRIHVKTVLRADLHIGDAFTLPPGIPMGVSADANVLGSGGAASPQRGHVTVEGMSFRIYRILHVGDFRSPHGADWSTNYEAQVAGEGGVSPPAADTGANVNSSSQNQNPNNSPTSQDSPPPPTFIPGLPPNVPTIDIAPQSSRVIPPLPRDPKSNVTYGSVYSRKGVRRYG